MFFSFSSIAAGHSEQVSLKKIVGDINDARLTRDALEGVDVVIHCASLVDISMNPDVDQLKKVNVDGTASLIDACIDRQVSYFIHISTVDVCIGSDQIYYGSEATTPHNKSPITGPYGETRKEAELLVKNANSRSHNSGKYDDDSTQGIVINVLFIVMTFNSSHLSHFVSFFHRLVFR